MADWHALLYFALHTVRTGGRSSGVFAGLARGQVRTYGCFRQEQDWFWLASSLLQVTRADGSL